MLRVISRPLANLGIHIKILPSLTHFRVAEPEKHSEQLQSFYSWLNSSTLPSSSTYAVTSWVQYMKYSKISKQNKEETNKVETISNRDPTCPPELFVVQPRLRPDRYLEAKLNEALCLANSLEEQRDGYFGVDFFDKDLPPHVVVQNPTSRGRKARADTFFGPGTVDNIKCHLRAAESKGKVDAIFVNSILSGIQQRNLERAWDRPVLDRVGLIIEIFNAHAYTKEARLQAELAALMYKRTRLVRMRGPDGRYTFGAYGEAEVVSARGRGSGGRGFISGAGETELHLQRRRILERRNYLISQIEDVRRTRALQRAGRKRHGDSSGKGLATVAIVGYTNAGKSTLVSALADSDLYSDSRLFATVDPRVRSAYLPSGRKVLFSDTVGFISDLPIQLVEAFHATLEEVVEADLLVHVVDSTAPNLDEHRSTVLQVLQQIGVTEEKLQNMIEVWNKIDMEESVVADNYLDDVGNDELSEDLEFDASTDIRKHDADTLPGAEDIKERFDQQDFDDVCHESPSNNQETVEAKEEYSNDWLYEDNLDDDGESPWSLAAADTQNESFSTQIIPKSCSVLPPGPHVKTSAIMGVGLQELLQLIDEKLRVEDEKMKKERLSEGGVFDRKWRPPPVEDTGTTVEQ